MNNNSAAKDSGSESSSLSGYVLGEEGLKCLVHTSFLDSEKAESKHKDSPIKQVTQQDLLSDGKIVGSDSQMIDKPGSKKGEETDKKVKGSCDCDKAGRQGK